MPLNVMPVLEYDGETISQSKTIARFLAKEVGIDGKTHVEQAKADMIVDCVKDIEDGMVIFIVKWLWSQKNIDMQWSNYRMLLIFLSEVYMGFSTGS